MTALGVPAGYNMFGNFGGMTADGALFTTAVRSIDKRQTAWVHPYPDGNDRIVLF